MRNAPSVIMECINVQEAQKRARSAAPAGQAAVSPGVEVRPGAAFYERYARGTCSEAFGSSAARSASSFSSTTSYCGPSASRNSPPETQSNYW